MKKLIKSKLFLQVIVASMVATLATVGIVAATTTIGANISTGGTLAVTGATTLSSTLAVTGVTTLSNNITVPGGYGLDTASGILNIGTTTATTINIGRSGQVVAQLGNSTVAGTLGVTGATTLSSTLGVTGVTTLTYASSTALTVSGTAFGGKLLVGTSTPSDANITAEFYKTGTSTISIDTNSTDKGSCIKLKNSAGTTVYCTVLPGGTTFTCGTDTCE